MDVQTFNHLAGAINYKFPGKPQGPKAHFEVVHDHTGINLTVWDEVKMGQSRPDEATMLQWIDEYEAYLVQKEIEEKEAEQKKAAAIERLKKSTNQDIADLLELLVLTE